MHLIILTNTFDTAHNVGYKWVFWSCIFNNASDHSFEYHSFG